MLLEPPLSPATYLDAALPGQVCEVEPLSLSLPPETERFLVPESATSNRPFSLKHAQQQASIVGNMKQQGLLAGAAGLTYVEYGAGKGYLR